MKILLIFICFTGFCIRALAQQPQLLQERNYKISAGEKGIFVSAPIGQGNIMFSGSELKSPSNYDHTFLLVNQNADTLWTRRGLTGIPGYMQALESTPDNGVIFGGAIKSLVGPTVNKYIMYLEKLDATGQISWNRSIFSNLGNINSITNLSNKGFMLGGSFGQGKNFSFVMTDDLGNFVSQKDYNRSPYDMVVDLQATPNGNIIALGQTSHPSGPYHPKLLMVNQNGDSLKGKQLIITGLNRRESVVFNFNSILPMTDGGYLLTTYADTITTLYPGGIDLGMVVKVDANLNLQWKYVHRTINTDEYAFTKAKELADGSVLVLGFKYRPNTGGNNNGFQLYRFGLNGQLMNVYPFNSNICSQVWGITLDALSDSTYLVGGRCGNNPPLTFGYYVAKVKIPGLPLPLPPITITSTKAELATAGAGLGPSYPNPATASAIIPYTLPQQYNKASILIREIATGKEIRRYELKRGHSSLNVELGSLSNGLYLYSLVVDEKPVATKKLAVMR